MRWSRIESDKKLGKHSGLVSIVIPVHNIQKTRKCLGALGKQTYKKMEIVQVTFKGFPAEKRNYGFEKSKGDFVLFLDEDEYLSPMVIDECVRKAKNGYDIVAIPVRKMVGRDYISQCLSIIRESTVKTMFFRKEVLLDIGLFDSEFIFCDDVEILQRAIRRHYKVGTISSGYMVHDEQVQLKNIIMKTIFSRKAFRNLRRKYGKETYQRIVKAGFQRSRILKEVMEKPKCVFGVLIIMAMRAVIRRMP